MLAGLEPAQRLGNIGEFEDAIDRWLQALLLDRRAHTVFQLAGRRDLRRLFEIGREAGHLIGPQAIALGRGDILAVLDTPDGLSRIQYFTGDGLRIGGFLLPMPDSPTPRINGALSVLGHGSATPMPMLPFGLMVMTRPTLSDPIVKLPGLP